MTNAMASRYPVSAGKKATISTSENPRIKPPRTAPLTLPMPPITAAIKHFKPGTTPMRGNTDGYFMHHKIAPTAASAEPMAKVEEITPLILIPMSLAVSQSTATARMAIPILVLLMIKRSADIRINATIGITRNRLKRQSANKERCCHQWKFWECLWFSRK